MAHAAPIWAVMSSWLCACYLRGTDSRKPFRLGDQKNLNLWTVLQFRDMTDLGVYLKAHSILPDGCPGSVWLDLQLAFSSVQFSGSGKRQAGGKQVQVHFTVKLETQHVIHSPCSYPPYTQNFECQWNELHLVHTLEWATIVCITTHPKQILDCFSHPIVRTFTLFSEFEIFTA